MTLVMTQKFSSQINRMIDKIKDLFTTKKEVVKMRGSKEGYAARYKRWYHLEWRYIGLAYSFPESNINFVSLFCTVSKSEAHMRLNRYFK